MKKTKYIIIIISLVILVCISLFGYNYIKKLITDYYAKSLKNYLLKQENSIDDLKTGNYYDMTNFAMVYDGVKPSQGKIFIDYDNSLNVIENIKINNNYCIYKNNKFDCNIKHDSKTGINLKLYKKYSIGDKVILNKESWHVIHESNKYSKYVTLIKDERVDIDNNDFFYSFNFTNDPDKIAFDTSGLKKYDVNKNTNIGYYLNNEYKKMLSNYITDIQEIRLPGSIELFNVKEKVLPDGISENLWQKKFNVEERFESVLMYEDPEDRKYDVIKDMILSEQDKKDLSPHWLFNNSSGNYWLLNEEKDNHLYTAVWNGDGIVRSGAKSTYNLKPVITINKNNIK